jgi:lipoprotein-releasing system permease protein
LKSFDFAKQEIEIKDIAGIASYTKIIEERVLFTFDDKQEVTYLKGVDANYSKVNAIESKLYNGQWLQPNTYQVVVGYGIAQNSPWDCLILTGN